MSGPLSGVKVVDLTINVLGPVSTMLLGDMGAEVIKVETPRGDDNRRNGPARHPNMGAFFLSMNRNKKSVVLNLRKPAGLEALMKLVDSADVLVHSMRPKAAEKLGFGYEAIAARNPRTIYAFAPGYRGDGPRRNDPAYDDVVSGESGVVSMMHRARGEPNFVPFVLIDKFCGYVLASSIGMALYAREKTGKGQEVHVPMLETIVSYNLLEHMMGGAFEPPMGGMGYPRLFSPDRKPYKTRDGYICLLAISDEQWKRLLEAMGCPEVFNDPRYSTILERNKNIGSLYAMVTANMPKKTTAEWREILTAADIPNGPVNELEDLLQDPYLNQTGFFRRYEHPTEGMLVDTAVPVQFSQTPGGFRLPPPTLGEHTRSILGTLGYSESQIVDLST